MLGSITGDIAGSRFEWNNRKSKDFELLADGCRPTDDSIMTLALAQAVLCSRPDWSDLSENAVRCMQKMGRKYPKAGYGTRFIFWLSSDHPEPYNSFGNGAAMRVSPAGYAAESMEEARLLARKVTEVTHNHPEGLKAAEAVAVAIFMARKGCSMTEIYDVIVHDYYPLKFTLHAIRPGYGFDVSCQGSVPQAFEAFFESVDFEDALRNAVSLGGDSDTIAAICGGIAEAYYGIPPVIRNRALTFLDQDQLQILTDFEKRYPSVRERDGAGIQLKGGRFRLLAAGLSLWWKRFRSRIAGA